MAKLDDRGHEILDSTPIAVPLKFRSHDHYDHIRQIIRQEMSMRAQQHGRESFEEADDFDIGDDYDPKSPWELDADQEHFVEEKPVPRGGDGGTSPHADNTSGQDSSQNATAQPATAPPADVVKA